jgi:hypothetical protein
MRLFVCLQRVVGNYIIEDEERVDAFIRSDLLQAVLGALSLDRSEKIQRLAAATIGNLYGVGESFRMWYFWCLFVAR